MLVLKPNDKINGVAVIVAVEIVDRYEAVILIEVFDVTAFPTNKTIEVLIEPARIVAMPTLGTFKTAEFEDATFTILSVAVLD